MANKYLRRINLDFHTSELIENVGSEFNKEDFKKALVLGHVNSITLFSKCHHGYAYFDSKVFNRHPHLSFNLLDEQVKAAHEVGVKTPIYITVGWSSKDAEEHPEWLARDFISKEPQYYRFDPHANPEDPKPFCSWKVLCPNSGYKEEIKKFVKEICERYNPVDGIFFDICFIGDSCGCESCIKGMIAKGYDPESISDAQKFYIEQRVEFMKEMSELIKSYNKNATIFFNGGANISHPIYHEYQTHFELEDLPTSWGGYDKLPIRAKYFTQKYSKQSIGMTGKFHTSWGEFGGYKKTNALKYEAANMIALGAGCSIGDQLHPGGKLDLETYRRIGNVYEYIEQIEDYCDNVKSLSKLGLILSLDNAENEGISKILMENQYNFNLIIRKDDFNDIECLIISNNPDLDSAMIENINTYYKNGGKLILIGNSINYFPSFDIEAIGQSSFDMDYIKANEDLMNLNSPLLAYKSAYKVKYNINKFKEIASVMEPYFNRTYGTYCSHRNTPNKNEIANYPASIISNEIAYIAHDIPEIYYEYGSPYHRDYFISILRKLFPHDYCEVKGLMTCGRMYFNGNDDHYCIHLFYATPILRGTTLIIEDLPTIYNTSVKIRTGKQVSKILKVPQMVEIQFEEKDGVISFNVDKFSNHQLIIAYIKK